MKPWYLNAPERRWTKEARRKDHERRQDTTSPPSKAREFTTPAFPTTTIVRARAAAPGIATAHIDPKRTLTERGRGMRRRQTDCRARCATRNHSPRSRAPYCNDCGGGLCP
jgi:hypothetical protein